MLRQQIPPQMRLFRGLAIAGALVALVAVVAFAALKGVSHRPQRAPALPAEVLSGKRVTIASLEGKPALVLFWAAWSDPNRSQATAVRRFAESPAGAGKIVGVDWYDRVKQATAFVARHHWRFPNLRDAKGKAGLAYGVTRLPALYVLDANGNVVKTLIGAQTQAGLQAALRYGYAH